MKPDMRGLTSRMTEIYIIRQAKKAKHLSCALTEKSFFGFEGNAYMYFHACISRRKIILKKL